MGIGLTAQNFKSNRLPGWEKQSYGYHGDDGKYIFYLKLDSTRRKL